MKTLVFVMMATLSMAFASCGNSAKTSEVVVNDSDSVAVDTVVVNSIDSVSVDSMIAVR